MYYALDCLYDVPIERTFKQSCLAVGPAMNAGFKWKKYPFTAVRLAIPHCPHVDRLVEEYDGFYHHGLRCRGALVYHNQ